MKQFVTFVAGAALGSIATWMLVKKKYEQIAQEEIDSVKEVYSRKKPKKSSENEPDVHVDEKEIKEYEETIESAGYSKYSDISKKKVEKKSIERPYVIRPEELGDLDGYEVINLTHYADGILADDNDDKMDDDEIADVVGADYAEHIGEYEDDVVHIRNDKLKCDYEIVFDLRNYPTSRNRGIPS